jgi:hypothetical protein
LGRCRDFEASFVPCVRDFARLDDRFWLPSAVWDALPAYADWGFAVFKLNKQATLRKVHPFSFAMFLHPTLPARVDGMPVTEYVMA